MGGTGWASEEAPESGASRIGAGATFPCAQEGMTQNPALLCPSCASHRQLIMAPPNSEDSELAGNKDVPSPCRGDITQGGTGTGSPSLSWHSKDQEVHIGQLVACEEMGLHYACPSHSLWYPQGLNS